MTEFRDLIEGQGFQPFVIETKGGRTFRVPHQGHYWLPEDFPECVVVAVRGQGLRVLSVDAIESVQLEHEQPVT
jgi:hypothetical protein